MADRKTGRDLLREWREKGDPPTSLTDLGEKIGDKDGGQVGKWERGERAKLPIQLCVALCRYTGLPLETFATRDQLALARELIAVAARDSGATA